ncbi:hypothetical protein SAMN04488066_12118 [Halorubrum aquaticum]|uniref:DUF7974 domain-containing protein n=1 Tax=Halorubrum aquaticum TaxID=387340 RepID=A0A1I3CBX9_9EURY|nr:hypothetical protein [Halorubrum aquaticum]SFH72028.1 hypothetical protein SAMN04488066_12118 [Halorubrum aquaticum]
MRRIYESDALGRDDDDPHAPAERDDEGRIGALRSVPAAALSDRLVPHALRRRFVSVDVETPRREYAVGEAVQFTVTFRNRVPFPVSIRTASPLPWIWTVDGDVEAAAATVSLRDPPDEPGRFAFDRGERKRFRRRWNGLFRVTDSEWAPPEPGTHVIGAAVNVANAEGKGLTAETTVRIVE